MVKKRIFEMNKPNFIIGGTNKAGTTSVFRYLSDHPQVCGSSVKETAFFVREYTGDLNKDTAKLGSYFAHCDSESLIRVEASTSYLALGQVAIPRMQQLLGEPKILFILRNPIERIYSYFNFHSGHLSIPNSVSFEDYLEICTKYDAGMISAEQVPFDAWHLKAPVYGRYAEYLPAYLKAFPRANIRVMLYDDLKNNPKRFMKDVSEFLGITADFYEDYKFAKSNVTFSSKNKLLHKIAVTANRGLERFLRQRPSLKARMVAVYKRINMAKQGYGKMNPETMAQLRGYYVKSNLELEELGCVKLPDSWK